MSPLVQSARLILQKYDKNKTRNEKLSRVLSANDCKRKLDFIKCHSRIIHIKAGNENEKGYNCIRNGNGNASRPLSIQSKSMSNIDDQSQNPEGIFLTEVRKDWFKKKQLKVSFNVTDDTGFRKHANNW